MSILKKGICTRPLNSDNYKFGSCLGKTSHLLYKD
jgi:hypothetical protein